LKIAFVYDAIYPFVKGGIEKRIFELSKALSAHSHEVHLFGMKSWEGPSVIEKEGVVFHGVCNKKEFYTKSGRRRIFQPLYFSTHLLKPLLSEKFDIVDCANFPYFPSIVSKMAVSLNKTPLVITWFEFWESYWFNYLGWEGVFGKAIEKICTKLTPYNIANSLHTKRKLQKFFKSPIPVIPNGINLQALEKAAPSKEKFDVCFVGRVLKEKNIDLILEAVALATKQRALNCIIIGEGPEKKTLQQKASKLELGNSVKFLDFVPEEEAYGFLKSSKLFLFPSHREGFGIAALEAMAQKCPVVTINAPENAARDLVKESNGGFVVSNSPSQISKAILELLENKQLLKKTSSNAAAFAQQFSWEKAASELESYYLKILNSE